MRLGTSVFCSHTHRLNRVKHRVKQISKGIAKQFNKQKRVKFSWLITPLWKSYILGSVLVLGRKHISLEVALVYRPGRWGLVHGSTSLPSILRNWCSEAEALSLLPQHVGVRLVTLTLRWWMFMSMVMLLSRSWCPPDRVIHTHKHLHAGQ